MYKIESQISEIFYDRNILISILFKFVAIVETILY